GQREPRREPLESEFLRCRLPVVGGGPVLLETGNGELAADNYPITSNLGILGVLMFRMLIWAASCSTTLSRYGRVGEPGSRACSICPRSPVSRRKMFSGTSPRKGTPS